MSGLRDWTPVSVVLAAVLCGAKEDTTAREAGMGQGKVKGRYGVGQGESLPSCDLLGVAVLVAVVVHACVRGKERYGGVPKL